MQKSLLQQVDDRFLDGLVFCGLVYEIFEQVRTTPQGPETIRMRRGKCKKLVEELLPICRYIQSKYRVGRYISVKWKDGNQQYDAEIHSTGTYVANGYFPSKGFVEVTCAVHPNDHLAREHLNSGGAVFGLEGLKRTRDHKVASVPLVHIGDEFIGKFATIVLGEITKKVAKPYLENTSLIIQCNLNRLYLSQEWENLISRVRKNVPIHNFSEVFLYDPVCEYAVSL